MPSLNFVCLRACAEPPMMACCLSRSEVWQCYWASGDGLGVSLGRRFGSVYDSWVSGDGVMSLSAGGLAACKI